MRLGAKQGRALQYLGMLSLVLLVLAGCSPAGEEGGGTASGNSRLTLRLVAVDQEPGASTPRAVDPMQPRQVAPGDAGFIAQLDIRIEATDLTAPITRSVSLTATQQTEVTVEILVPVGANRRIIVTALNANRVTIFRGETTVDLTQEQQSITILLLRQDLIPAPATAANLANRTFTFADGAAFGLPGLEVTLAFGAFEANTGLFILSAGGSTASGSVTLTPQATLNSLNQAVSGQLRQDGAGTPCDFHIITSTFQQGPQAGQTLTKTCQTDAVDGRLIVDATSTSGVPTATVDTIFSSRLTLLVTIPRQVVPAQVAPGDAGFIIQLDIRVEAADLISPITESVSLTETQQTEVSVELLVPLGANRRIIVTALNANTITIFQGETTIDLTQEQQSVTILLLRQDLIPAPATAANLANRTFTFADGAVFGLPGLEVTLAFGAFEANTGLFTLSSGGFTASGSVAIVIPSTGSSLAGLGQTRQEAASTLCDLNVVTSTYATGQGPQAGDILPTACQTDTVDNRLIVQNTSTTARSTSLPPVTTVNITFPFILDVSRLDDPSVVLVEQAP